MNQTEIGKFIAKCRKGKNLTQAQLAEKLNITDRAVSKWETGKSMPDSSIMLELCEILGITVNELLSGEEISVKNKFFTNELCSFCKYCAEAQIRGLVQEWGISMGNYEKKADENLIALKRKEENNTAKNAILSILFSAVFLIGIIVCLICNLAISGSLTWSLIPVSSIVFAWVILFPSIIMGKRGIAVSFISLSVFIIPYLFLLSNLIKVREVFSIGAVMAAVSIVFLWIIAAVFRRIGKTRRLAALGISFLSAIPFVFIINVMLSKMIAEPIFDVWDLLSVFLLLILAFVSFICDYAGKKGMGA